MDLELPRLPIDRLLLFARWDGRMVRGSARFYLLREEAFGLWPLPVLERMPPPALLLAALGQWRDGRLKVGKD